MFIGVLFSSKRNFLIYINLEINSTYIFHIFNSWKTFLKDWIIFTEG